MGHSRFSPPRFEMIAGVKYVRALVVVVERHDNGRPKLVRYANPDSVNLTLEDTELVYAPEDWVR